MTIPQITKWSPKALLLGSAAVVGGFVGIVTGVDALAEAQPFATKNMLVAQAMAVNQSVNDLRWDQLSYGIDNLQFQLGQKQFQLIQLEDLIEADPSDQIKENVKRVLEAELEAGKRRLEKMRCQFEQRGRPSPSDC